MELCNVKIFFGHGMDDDMEKKNGQKLMPLTRLQMPPKKIIIQLGRIKGWGNLQSEGFCNRLIIVQNELIADWIKCW